MPGAWSGRIERQRSREVRRIEREHGGTAARGAKREAEEGSATETEKTPARLVAD